MHVSRLHGNCDGCAGALEGLVHVPVIDIDKDVGLSVEGIPDQEFLTQPARELASAVKRLPRVPVAAHLQVDPTTVDTEPGLDDLALLVLPVLDDLERLVMVP